MIISPSEVVRGEVLDADVVVVGAGAAGIPLSLELAAAGLQVLLVEGGGEKVEARNQALYAGTVRNPMLHPPADKYRHRRLGGTTGVWGGRCVPFDPLDTKPREYIPHSGWPIPFEEVEKYYPAANEWLEAGVYQYSSSKVFLDGVSPMFGGFESEIVSIDSLERFSRPTDLYKRYKARLKVSKNLQLIYGANCTNISLSASGSAVEHLDVLVLDGKNFSVRGKYYVLATGGIETARLLLASGDVQAGIGNENDVVGRYYMCHIAGNVGQLKLYGANTDVRHGYEVSPEGVYCRRRISLTESEQRRRQVNNVTLRLHFPRIADPAHKSGVLSLIYMLKPFVSYEYATRLRDSTGDTIRSTLLHLKNILSSPLEITRFLFMWTIKRILASRKFPSIILENTTNAFSLEVHGEQCPNSESRVYLSDEKDELGMPRAIIDWRYEQQDILSAKATLEAFGEELERQNLGSLHFDVESLEEELLRFGAYGGHHMGTARMGTDPRTSVVDRNCKVHSVSNLFISGSAVFPTSSQANPTLTITALALRLAEHIAGLPKEMPPGGA
jgi:choline dehydrogenase-like flavoprotein